MNCTFPDNSPRTELAPITVVCQQCGRHVTTAVFPVRARCNGNPIAKYVRKLCTSCGDAPPVPDPVTPRRRSAMPIGDWLSEAIHTASMGRIQPCAACDKRRVWLNQFGDKLARWWKGTP